MNRCIKSSLIDLLVLSVLLTPLFPAILWSFKHFNKTDHQIDTFISIEANLIIVHSLMYYAILIIGWSLFKDVFNISLGKRIYKLVVIDSLTKNEANRLQKLTRNLTYFSPFPVELFMKISKPQRRLVDILARTELLDISSK